MADSSYVIKRVDFFGRTVKICMQNMNGPCPLLAIANVLSLRNELKLPAGIREITQADLITAIVDLLLERSKHYEASAAHAADYQQNISDVFPVLQKLTTGIDVNVKFHNAHAFEPTPEVAVFDLLGIPLVHGWLADPQDSQTAAVFGNKSYNELMEVMLAGLDDAEVEALSTGPLRNLSIQYSSFSSTQNQHQQAAAEATVQQQHLQQQQDSSGTEQQEQQGLQGGQLGSTTATALVDPGFPHLPAISTSDCPTELSAAVAVAAATGVQQQQAQGDDAVIEQLVEDMLQHVCCGNMPDTIELGDSPTRSMSLTRRMAYEGAGPSRLSSTSSKGGAVISAAAAAAAAVNSGPNSQAGSTGGATASSKQQQDKGRAAADAHVVRNFMESHCSQLTPYGLTSLGESLKEHQLAMFFRNNHFNTLFKYEGGIYLLVTDQGYECEPDIVWERLDSVNGDTTYCTGAFTAFVPHKDPNAALTYSQAASGEATSIAAGQTPHPSALTDYDAAIAASLAAESGGDLHMNPNFYPRYVGSGSGAGGHHPQHGLAPGEDHEDADFALALQLQLQEEEAARVAAEQQQQRGGAQQQQQQPGGRISEQRPAHQQASQQLQQHGESLAASVRQMGRRIASGVERTAASIQQQAAQMAAPEYAGQQQQQQQHVLPAHVQHRRTAVPAAGAGRRRQQQDEKCSIM